MAITGRFNREIFLQNQAALTPHLVDLTGDKMVWDIHFYSDKYIPEESGSDEEDDAEPSEDEDKDEYGSESEEEEVPKDENGRTLRQRKALEYFCIFEKGFLDKKKE